jgi:hypothetical protein
METNTYQIYLPSAFKILICFLTVCLIFHLVFIERDFMKALLLLNVITNYRSMIAFLTDWNEEVLYHKMKINNDTVGIGAERLVKSEPQLQPQPQQSKSNFMNLATSEDIGDQINLYDYIINDEYDIYNEWWRN